MYTYYINSIHIISILLLYTNTSEPAHILQRKPHIYYLHVYNYFIIIIIIYKYVFVSIRMYANIVTIKTYGLLLLYKYVFVYIRMYTKIVTIQTYGIHNQIHT